MSLLAQIRQNLEPQLHQPLSNEVQVFLHTYFQCEALALAWIRKGRLEHNRKVIERKLARLIGQPLTKSNLQQAINNIPFGALKTHSQPTRVYVDELRNVFDVHTDFNQNHLDLIFNTNTHHRRKGQKSARILRNEIVHGLSKSAQNEVTARYETLMKAMQSFVGLPENNEGATR